MAGTLGEGTGPEVLTPAAAATALSRAAPARFVELFRHGTLSVEYYKPEGVDLQKPHERDEIYVVVAGRGTFINGGVCHAFEPGQVLFVPAGLEHRFVDFTPDFATWVFFYGPVGGERR